MSERRRRATIALSFYGILIFASIILEVLFPDSSVGFFSMMILGLPWSTPIGFLLGMLIQIFSSEYMWFVTIALCTLPNLILIIRHVVNLYIEEKVQVD